MQDLYAYFQYQLPRVEQSLQDQLQTLNSTVRPVASHILQGGGKRLRPILCVLTAEALGSSRKDIYPLASALELIHSATLLHDDVLDKAQFRRGNPAAHEVFGITQTILAGDALLALANKVVTSFGSVELVSCISEAIYHTAAGEVLEIQRMQQPNLSWAEYLEIIKGKTGYLIQNSCLSGAILAASSPAQQDAAARFGFNLGVAFQLVDDALDYSLSSKEAGKPLGGDLREGKLTLPLILFLERLDPGQREGLLARIKEQGLSSQEQDWILEQIRELGLDIRTRQTAGQYLQKAREAALSLPQGASRSLLLDMVRYIQQRES
ncbi:MAG: polyprenyl synthetase family protein [Desulfohalobiaceae bacterium]